MTNTASFLPVLVALCALLHTYGEYNHTPDPLGKYFVHQVPAVRTSYTTFDEADDARKEELRLNIRQCKKSAGY